MKIDVFELVELSGSFVLGERAERFDFSFGNDGDATGEGLDFFHVVGGEKDGGAGFVEFAYKVPELATEFDVHPSRWFVEDEELWFVDECFAYQEAALHATGEFADGCVGYFGEREAGENLIGPTILLFDVEEPGLDLEGFARGEEGVEVYFLWNETDHLTCGFVFTNHVLSEYGCASGCWGDESGDDADRCRLAGTVWTKESEDFARLNL